MNTLQDKEAALQSDLKKVRKLNALQKTIEKLVKKGGFKSLAHFVAELDAALGGEAPAKPAQRSPKAKARKKGSRPRISDAELQKMKELHEKKLSAAKIGAKLGRSEQTVYNWVKRGFKR